MSSENLAGLERRELGVTKRRTARSHNRRADATQRRMLSCSGGSMEEALNGAPS
jgi:hypothetical protein